MFLYEELSLLWGVKTPSDVTPETLVAAHAVDPPPDLLIVGCGDAIEQLPEETVAFFRDTETTLEVLDTVRPTPKTDRESEEESSGDFGPIGPRRRSSSPIRARPTIASDADSCRAPNHTVSPIAAERDRDVQHSRSGGEAGRRRDDPSFVVTRDTNRGKIHSFVPLGITRARLYLRRYHTLED